MAQKRSTRHSWNSEFATSDRNLLPCHCGEILLYCFFISEQLLDDAAAILYALEMRQTVREFGQIEVKLGAATELPEKMRTSSGGMVEEIFAPPSMSSAIP
jgi:hypothetical protein